ncbi:MAG: right-handed parallel beta-helix repeat-containing protein, partial [bacterium]
MKKAHFDYFLKILCFGRPWFLLLSVYCVALLFGMVSSANAKIYYVSKQGYDIPSNVDSPGPDSNACLTVMYLIDNTSLQGGDIVYIQEGIYDEHIVITSADDGTEGLYVTFKSYENDTVILIDTVYDSNDYAIVEIGNHPTNTARYIMWDGSGTDNGHHIIIDGNNTAQRCMQLRNACNIWLKNIEMKDASNPSYKRECLKLLSWEPDTKSGGVDDNKGCKNCLIEYCAFHGGGDYGIKVTGWGTDNNIFRYNMIYNNGSADGESNYGVNQSGNYYNSNPPTGNTWHDNEFYNNYSNGLQILVGPNTKIYNNKIYNNGQGVSSGKG